MSFGNNTAFSVQKNKAGLRYYNSFSAKLQLKQGIWLYFFLLLFEGALRKWFLPGLSTPLLLIRDPLAIWLILKAWENKIPLFNSYVCISILIGIVGVYTAVFGGHGNLYVALYGARILYFHFPLMFVIGEVFNRDDVEKVGKALLWVAIPMTVLIALQFYSPQSAWVNRGVGGDMNGAGFAGALDYLRPPATFSFTNGTTLFYSLVSCFVLYFWINPKGVSRLVLIAATISLLSAIPLSISRSLFFQFGVCLVFAMVAISRKPQLMGRMIIAVLAGIVGTIVLSKTSFFSTATEAFTARFETANEQEGGMEGVLGDRYLGSMLGALGESLSLPFWGYGLGMGTSVGSMVLAGARAYLIAEDEWGRVIGELGPLLGLSVIFLRLGLCIKLAFASYYKLGKGDFLPWMLLSFGLLCISKEQWAQPTSLGFYTVIGGLILASLKNDKKHERVHLHT